MAFASAISEHPLATQATGEVIGQVLEQLGPAPDLALLFTTGPFAGAFEDIAAAVQATLGPRCLVGASAGAVIGGGREVEGGAAVSLFAGRVAAEPRALRLVDPTAHRDGRATVEADLVGASGILVLLAAPAFPIEPLVDHLQVVAPRLVVVGGPVPSPGGTHLVLDDELADHGAVALLLPPGVPARAVVSQACDPVGDPLVVTRAEGRMVEEIAGRPALDVVLATAEAASPEDRSRMARGLQLGVAIDERRVDLDREDFEVHAVLGADKDRRAIAVATEVPVGTTVQFHVQDARSADADLRDLLADAPGRAALVFPDAGRGTSLFPDRHHDASIVAEHVESTAVAGVFCSGPVGPVGGRTRPRPLGASVVLLGG